MFPYSIAFDSVWYLLLLALVPLLWWYGRKSLSGLGRGRRWMALLLRTVVLVLIILSLAEMQIVRRSEKLTVLYLLDQSLSIPEAQRRRMVEFVNESIERHRDHDRRDRAGVVVFGRDAAVELPPIDENVPVSPQIESLINPEYTDLAGAMKLARALFPHDAAKRVVIVSDGNENMGEAETQAQALVDAGISIDVVPVRSAAQGEVAVEKVAVSTDVRRGQPFDLRVVLNNTNEPTESRSGNVSGRLRIIRRKGERVEEIPLADGGRITLPPGKRVVTIRETIEQPDFYRYEARFVPDDPRADGMPQNNRASTFTHVRGRGHILLIEDWAQKGQFDLLIERLRNENLEVTVQSSDQLFTSLAELQRYDTVILANVPRSTVGDGDQVTNFSDDQIAMLVRNTEQMGSGLLMLGGDNSFGAGGWTNTELEKAMPVDFQIKAAKVEAVGALALIMHAGEMPKGNFWQRVVAREAIKALGAQDYCGLIHWSGTDQWLWAHPQGMLRVGENRRKMLGLLGQMTPGDMPQFDPSMVMAANSLAKLPGASAKHMIIISDGDPSPPTNQTLQRLRKLGVKVSTVAVGSHGMLGSNIMQRIATVTGGKYYVVRNAAALPKIYQREARRVARPLIYEDKSGMQPQVQFPHEIIKGLGEQLPPFTGYVMTTVKESPLVEVALTAPKPAGEKNRSLLAAWTYGLGKSVAFTTDAGTRWTQDWTGWENYNKLFSQMVRWTMRPVDDAANFTLATDVEDGKARIVISALDKDDEYLNFLDMSGSVVGPDMKPLNVEVRQTAPGRYVAEFDADDSGSYMVMLNPGAGRAPIRTGVSVPYSAEFRQREANLALLESLASKAPRGGEPGRVVTGLNSDAGPTAALKIDPFRRDLPPSTASRDTWHLLMLAAAVLFFADVFNRRVNVSFDWLKRWMDKVKDQLILRQEQPEESVVMSRLRSRKEAIGDQLSQKRASARFEPQQDAPAAEDDLLAEQQGVAPPPRAKPPSRQGMAPEQKEESYTERLLKAKKKVWDERKK